MFTMKVMHRMITALNNLRIFIAIRELLWLLVLFNIMKTHHMSAKVAILYVIIIMFPMKTLGYIFNCYTHSDDGTYCELCTYGYYVNSELTCS